MKYRISRQGEEKKEITTQQFENNDDAYELLEAIYGDMCFLDVDYEDRPYHEIVEEKDWLLYFFLAMFSLFNVGNSTEWLRWNKKASYAVEQTLKGKEGKPHSFVI